MHIETKRRLVGFLKIAEPSIDLLVLLAIALFFLQFPPLSTFSADPATGGDTGSHFWPLVTLVKHSLPEFSLRVWNPGNLGGEPQLVHYFPLPYFIMAALSIFVPLGTAFNIGTLLPLLMLPISVYIGIRLFGWKFPIPILAACASLTFLYNESFSMWGGNALSTMAGQFAHLYALNFLMLAIGCFARELRLNRFPFWSSLLFAAVNLSHAYVMLGLPLIFMSFILFSNRPNLKARIITVITAGTFAGLLSAWFVIPMLTNAEWTIPHSFRWVSPNILAEVVPEIFYPILVIMILSACILCFISGKENGRKALMATLFWCLPAAAYVAYYFLFPYLGLVDVRAFPQVELFFCILSAILFGLLLQKKRTISFLAVMPIAMAALIWTNSYTKNFPSWVKWNYSGWQSKPAYSDLKPMYDHLRGDFSMPRVIYEHNLANGSAGTERVFEMLPYFANRATLESVYLQASILAPAAFLLQAEISKTPSCPFSQFDCAPYNILGAQQRLKLLGVGELILQTRELLMLAEENDYLEKDGKFGMWTLYRTKEQPSLVELFSHPPLLSSNPYWQDKFFKNPSSEESKAGIKKVPVDPKNWKELFYYWLKNYQADQSMIIVDRGETIPAIQELRDGVSKGNSVWGPNSDCIPELKVEFNRMHLKTNCPGKAHYLKFAFHSSWKTDTGDQPFLVSPGFIGLIPSKEEVTLTFGASTLWRISGIVSIFSFLLLIILAKVFSKNKFTNYL